MSRLSNTIRTVLFIALGQGWQIKHIYTVPYFPVLPGLPFEPKSDIPRLHKSSIQGFHVQDRSDHPKPSEQLGRLDIIVKPILQG